MKILMATMGLDIGGAETHIVELSKHLQNMGHQVMIASNGGVYVPEITACGIKHFNVPMHRRDVKCMTASRKKLKEIIATEQPDIVHAHARIPGFLCGSLHRSMGFPFVTTCHGVYQFSGALKLLSNWGQRTLAVSEDIVQYLIQNYRIPRDHIRLTINGIDTDAFSPTRSGGAIKTEFHLTDAPVLCHVSRMDAATVIVAQMLTQIAPQLDAAIPGIQILIVGGGDGLEELRQQAQDVNRRMGRECLILTGARTDVAQLVAAGDVFVGVSRAALEAMSTEKPVVLSGAQGHSGIFQGELLADALETNFCCRNDPLPTKERLLTDVTAAFRLSPDEARELGEYGRTVVMSNYSVARMAQDCVEVYAQVKKPKYRVLMSGYYGFSNAGDDAILQSIHQGIIAASDEIAVTVLSNEPESTKRLYDLDAIPRFKFWKVVGALRHCDALLSGGGSLLQDRTSTRSLLYYLSIIRMAELLKKPVMLYANGIGPVQKPANRRRVKKAVERASLVTLRDQSSAQELKDMGVTREDLYVTADPVFNLEPADQSHGRELLRLAKLPEGAPFLAVSVRDWPAAQKFPEQVAVLCDHIRRSYGLEVLFLLMQPSKDRASTLRVQAAMQESSYLLEEPCSPRELMAVLGEGTLCLAMRLHTLIFAARMAVPTLGLVYDPKVASYLNELDLPSVGDVEQFDIDQAIAVTDTFMGNYDQVLAGLKIKSISQSAAAQENERRLLNLLEKTKK